MKKQLLALTLVACLGSALIGFAAPAFACRDCPFPMKIGQHQWLLPKSDLILTIEEDFISATEVIMTVTLQDSSNGRMIAMGRVYRTRAQRVAVIQMRDRSGHKMRGSLKWSDESHNNLQAEFECLELCAESDLTATSDLTHNRVL